MDLRKLKTLIDLVSESNVSELEITEAALDEAQATEIAEEQFERRAGELREGPQTPAPEPAPGSEVACLDRRRRYRAARPWAPGSAGATA